MPERSGQSKRARLLLLAAALWGCGGKALQQGEASSKPDARPDAATDGGVEPADASDAGLSDASDASVPDANAADGATDAALPPLSDLPWKATPTPLCLGSGMQASAHSVWSDGKSVYVVAATPGASNGHLFSNDGRGWVQANAAFDASFLGITGFASGELIVSEQSASCGIEFITGGTQSCSAPLYAVDQVAVVDGSLAYAVNGGGVDPTQVIRYNGSYWSDAGISFDDGAATSVVNAAIWAAPGLLAVTSKSGALHLFKTAADGANAILLGGDAPAGVYTALWGSSVNDVWAGNQAGDLLHRTGTSWSVAARVEGCGGIKGIWGVGATVYFITDSAFGQWSNGVVRTVSQLPCGDLKFSAIWGNSASEIFVTLSNPDLDASGCGGSRAIWYNGSELGAL